MKQEAPDERYIPVPTPHSFAQVIRESDRERYATRGM